MADAATKKDQDLNGHTMRDEPWFDVATYEICMDAGSVTDVFRAIAATIDEGMIGCKVDPEAVREALTRREREGSTAIGQGRAIPHARVEGLSESILLDVKLRRPVRWDDGEEVQRCMVILVPPEAHDLHLQLTAKAVRALRDD